MNGTEKRWEERLMDIRERIEGKSNGKADEWKGGRMERKITGKQINVKEGEENLCF